MREVVCRTFFENPMVEFSFRKETNFFSFSELEVGQKSAFEKALHSSELRLETVRVPTSSVFETATPAGEKCTFVL